EFLKRLEDNDRKFEEEMKRMREESERKWNEYRAESDRKFQEFLKRLEDNDRKFEEEMKRMREESEKRMAKFEEEMKRRDEEFKRNFETIQAEINNTIARYSMSLEEEAKTALEWKLKGLGYDVKITDLEIPYVVEVDLFATFDNYVLIGEVKVTARSGAVEQLEYAIDSIRKNRPELIEGKKIIPVIFSMRPKYIQKECEEKGIFLTDGYNDYTDLKSIMGK
ncbi:hypothetical protein, partial [Metallosphaera javensis (ex Hofmann et al. 2022)]|uniref:hypothetical protein n=1 Tax=Metallosphaera javensis (ex Hofmann et al. 2022) TaxID=99938 RepID=UPI001EE0FA42